MTVIQKLFFKMVLALMLPFIFGGIIFVLSGILNIPVAITLISYWVVIMLMAPFSIKVMEKNNVKLQIELKKVE